MDRLEAMATLLIVAETGSFSAASRKLRVPVTTVSRRVADLEAHIGAKLLQRTTRKVTLTDVGGPYVAVCRKAIEQLEEAERVAAGEYQSPRGEITITAPLILGRMHLVPLIAEFLAQFLDVQMRCRFSDRFLALQEEQIDVAVRVGELSDSGLRARRVGTIHRIVCASPNYLARRGEPRALSELGSHDCVPYYGFDPPGHWQFQTEDGPVTVPIHSRLSFDSIGPAIDAGIAGVGLIQVASYQVRTELRSGALREVLPEFAPHGLPVHIIRGNQEIVPLKVRAFVEYCAPRLQARLDA